MNKEEFGRIKANNEGSVQPDRTILKLCAEIEAMRDVVEKAVAFYNVRYLKSNEEKPDYWKTAAQFDLTVKGYIEKGKGA